jgi:hypothetical protein
MQLPADLARELEGLIAQGGADPFTLLAGQWSFHSCFLAPFSPAFAELRRQFLVDGGGPLAEMAVQLRQQGLAPAEAAERARQIVEHAQGLLVAVLAGDHGVATVPQPFFGHLSPDFCDHAAQAVGTHAQAFRAALAQLPAAAAQGWPHAVAGPARSGDVRGYWLELGHGLAEALETVGGRGDGRLADLGHWVGSAVATLAVQGLDAEDEAMLARCHLVCGETGPATARIAACAAAGGEEAVIELLDALATATVQRGGDPAAADWLAGTGLDLAARLGCAYDAALALVRVRAAAGEAMVAEAIDALLAANRKLARQALTREPLWQVTCAEPGELLDTAAAAQLVGRSPAFISKRLEARTIPFHARDGQVRLPRAALAAWQAAMERHRLLD